LKKSNIPGLLPLLLFFFFSCATSPRVPDPLREETAFLPLEPGGSVYLLADASACRPILDRLEIRGMSALQSREIFDRTRSVAAALYPEGHERRFQAVAWGQYPGFRGSLALASGKDWEKGRSKTGGAYYYSAAGGLSVALSDSRAFVSGGGPGNKIEPFAQAPGTEIPEDFAGFRQGAALAFWVDEPGAPVNRIVAAAGIPLQIPAEQLLICFFPHRGEGEGGAAETDAQYEGRIRIRTPAASQARALVILLNMALEAAPAESAEETALLEDLLFANPPLLDGRSLNIRTAPLDAAQIALLFELFQIYSN
jgi:hypothetical protein